MERGEIEILLQEKLIKLLSTSISFDSRSNRNKTYSLLGLASRKRSVKETIDLINEIDKQIASFEADSIKYYFKENASRLNLFKEDIDEFISRIDKRLETLNSDVEVSSTTDEKEEVKKLMDYVDNSVDEAIKEAEENKEMEEYSYFKDDKIDEDLTIDNNSKLTRDEIDGFIRKIDDKLAELSAEEAALDA